MKSWKTASAEFSIMFQIRLLLVLGITVTLVSCISRVVILQSQAIEIVERGELEHIPNSSLKSTPWGKVKFDVLNDVGLSSEAKVFGIKTEEDSFGMRKLDSEKFVISFYFEPDLGVEFSPYPVHLQLGQEKVMAIAKVPINSDHPLWDCANRTEGLYQKIEKSWVFKNSETGERHAFCIRYEFPVPSINPNTRFIVDFGAIKTPQSNFRLKILFEGVERVVTTTH